MPKTNDTFEHRSGRKKNIRATATQEFARSISVPADRLFNAPDGKPASGGRRQALSNEER